MLSHLDSNFFITFLVNQKDTNTLATLSFFMQENSLIHETSPYLLQHAKNPVQWYSWNETTLKKAKEENKPIFLSIRYSLCHCFHVMAHESFENQ